MATWYRKELGDGVQAFLPSNRIIDAFFTFALAQAKVGCPIPDAAVFSHSEPGASRVIVYFTPSAELLAKQFDAVPCSKPVLQTNFSLIAGDTRVWDTHFPDYRAKRPSISS